MRIKFLIVPLIAAGAIFLSSCKKNSVSLSFTNAKNEVPELGNLVFRFSHSLATDSMLNVWDSTEYISFEPAIPGRFRWQSPDELVFSPSQPLNPATNYKAKIKSAVLRFSKYNSVKNGDKISFHTPELTLNNYQVLWVGESSTSAIPQIDLFFNYRINPEILKDRLKLEVEGKKADFNMITISPDNKISVRINGLKSEDKDSEVKVVIEKGLKPEKGNMSTSESITSTMTIPSPYVLTVQNLESEYDGTEGVVRITTSQQLTGEGIKSYLKFDPEVEFAVEPNDFGFTLRSDKFDAEKSYALVINKGLRGKLGGVMKEEYNGSVAFGELEAN
ncbi:MAG TPA: hypothetical protein PK977_11630, partial [Chitinophagaceae bacterium]|nr:hypothetical protein [Chitinophagaceae bacterium]